MKPALSEAKGALVAMLLLAGCARMEPPPGGPPDFNPPKLTAIVPESLVVLPDFRGDAEFHFDELVSEGQAPNFGVGNGTLESLVLLSPDTTVPDVHWRHRTITVRPRGGWRPNTVYRIELAPGLRDVSPGTGNATTVSSVITFSTGGPAPTRFLRGRVIDWSTQRSSPLALILARRIGGNELGPYRTHADSTGRFSLGPLPAGSYLVEANSDPRRKNLHDDRAPWDTVRIDSVSEAVGEIWIFPRDTTAPKSQSMLSRDSLTIVITLTQSVDPQWRSVADSVFVRHRPDSTLIPVIGVYTEQVFDSLNAKPPPKPDSGVVVPQRPARDVAAEAAARDLPEQVRPKLGPRIIVRMRAVLRPGDSYDVEVRGVRTAGGAVGTVNGRVTVPKAQVDSAKVDSSKTVKKPDTTLFQPRRP